MVSELSLDTSFLVNAAGVVALSECANLVYCGNTVN
jgi:hypothetical protein